MSCFRDAHERSGERRQQHKTRNNVGGATSTRERLLRRCVDRARAARQENLRRLRGGAPVGGGPLMRTVDADAAGAAGPRAMAASILEQEWAALRSGFKGRESSLPGKAGADAAVPGTLSAEGNPTDEDGDEILRGGHIDDDEMAEIERAIMEELLLEESITLEQHALCEAGVEAELDAAITAFASMSVEEAVLCPLCRVHNIRLIGTVFVCSCSFRLDTGSDPLTLGQLRERLAWAYDAHYEGEGVAAPSAGLKRPVTRRCEATPVCSLEPVPGGGTMLCLRCSECDTLRIIC